MYEYAYFVGCMMLFGVWVVFYLLRNDLRKELFFGSFLGLPFGITEIFFIHEYWYPPSLFNLIAKYGFGVEDFIFSFFVGGIAAIIYEVVTKSKVKKFRPKHRGILPIILFTLLFLVLEAVFPHTTIYNIFIALCGGSLYIGLLRRDLFTEMLVSGLTFGLLYFFLFLIFNHLFPDFIKTTYNLANLTHLSIMNIPIEEFLFAFFLGSTWSVIYEYVKGFKLVRGNK